MDEITILHFAEEGGDGEYIVMTDDPDADPEDHRVSGYKLKGKHTATIDKARRLPLGYVLQRRE